MSKIKKAIFLSGSGSAFVQEVAIIDQLVKNQKLSFDESDTLLVASGTSAVNLVAINACFSKSKTLRWKEDYKNDFLDILSNNEIFLKTDPVFWNTLPMRHTLNQLLRRTNFDKLGDLPFQSTIIVAENSDVKIKWLSSKSKKTENVNLGDALMASSAVPVIFPPIILNSVNDMPIDVKDGAYAEGGKNGLYKKFRKNLKKLSSENGPLDEFYIISPSRSNEEIDLYEYKLESMSKDERSVFNEFWENISLNHFLNFLSELEYLNRRKKIASKIYVCIPEIYGNQKVLSFTDLATTYNLTFDWFENNKDRLAVDLVKFNQEVSSLV